MQDLFSFLYENREMVFIIILSIFLGIEVIAHVPSVLHTPLMSGANAIHGVVIIGSITFIIGLKQLSHPLTARKGNLIAAGGMTLAILATILLYQTDGEHLHNYGWIFGGILIGSVVGWMAAKRVKMTAMPQMVSLFNGMGGACAAIISIIEYPHMVETHQWNLVAVTLAGLLIGGTSFAGSMIAFGKLNGNI